jgi:hypothetical protein
VPASLGPTTKFVALLPRRVQDALARVVKSDEVMSRADHAARAAYEARAAASAPAARRDRGGRGGRDVATAA